LLLYKKHQVSPLIDRIKRFKFKVSNKKKLSDSFSREGEDSTTLQ